MTINGSNIATDMELTWQAIDCPEAKGSVKCLQAISCTGHPQDVARYQGGNIYTITTDRGFEVSQVNRFMVRATSGDVDIDDATIMPIEDTKYKGTPSGIVYFSGVRDLFFTDGALRLNSLDGDNTTKAFIKHNGKGLDYTIPVELG